MQFFFNNQKNYERKRKKGDSAERICSVKEGCGLFVTLQPLREPLAKVVLIASGASLAKNGECHGQKEEEMDSSVAE